MSCSCKNGGNMFFYSRKKEGKGSEVLYALDSLNLSKIIRTIEMDNGDYLVLMDDLHQRKEKVNIFNKKNQKTGEKYETNTYQSEVTILKETGDAERFKQLTEIQ